MMTEEQRLKVGELKVAVAASTSTREGAPREVRTAVVALRRELRGAGLTAGSVAEALGVHVSTLCRWERDVGAGVASASRAKRRGRAASFRVVEVTARSAAPITPVVAAMSSDKPGARGLRVAHAPSGLVVDGLDVETLAALLRRMA